MLYISCNLIEYIPLQQGLRPVVSVFLNPTQSHWVYSITTRIKTFYNETGIGQRRYLIEYIPLQQGLRHFVFPCFTRFLILIEYIPLQQGLRLLNSEMNTTFLSHWVYSITTRIKTADEMVHNRVVVSLSIFHYNKD